LVDDDAVPQIGWLEELSRPFRDSSVACVGGQAIGPNDRSAIRSRARDAGRFRWYGRFIGHFGTVCTQRTVAADSVLEGNCAWRRDVLRTLRRDAFFNVGDSLHYGMDLCLEAQAQGWKVLYASRAIVVHHEAQRPPGVISRDDRSARCFFHGRNFTYIGLRHFKGLRRAVFPLWWLLVGERQSYGVLTGIYDLVSTRGRTWPLVVASFRGRRAGWRAWRHGEIGGA
jgi:GT2 family glycosyltransferase